MTKKLIADDPGYLRKIAYWKKGAPEKDPRFKKMAYLAGLVEASGNNDEQLGFESSAPTMYRGLSEYEFSKVLSLKKFIYAGSYYEEVVEQLHPDLKVFVHVGNVEGLYEESLAIAKFLESFKEEA